MEVPQVHVAELMVQVPSLKMLDDMMIVPLNQRIAPENWVVGR